jgi:hypothetical protein
MQLSKQGKQLKCHFPASTLQTQTQEQAGKLKARLWNTTEWYFFSPNHPVGRNQGKHCEINGND